MMVIVVITCNKPEHVKKTKQKTKIKSAGNGYILKWTLV